MTVARIPVDLRNPGQVFACVGFVEAAEIICGHTRAAFEAKPGSFAGTFALEVEGHDDPISEVLDFLLSARVEARAPRGSGVTAERWGVPTSVVEDGTFPFPPPDKPAMLPAVLMDEAGREVPIEHWGDGSAVGRDNVKFWAGAGGYPGAGLIRDALDLLPREGVAALRADPFSFHAPQSSSLRFDWRRDYIPLDAGFSPNKHGAIVMVGYPLVEILAAIGLQHARPERVDKLAYRYGVSTAFLPAVFVRAVLGAQSLGFPIRTFRMQLGWPGQEGQARCIIDAREEYEA